MVTSLWGFLLPYYLMSSTWEDRMTSWMGNGHKGDEGRQQCRFCETLLRTHFRPHTWLTISADPYQELLVLRKVLPPSLDRVGGQNVHPSGSDLQSKPPSVRPSLWGSKTMAVDLCLPHPHEGHCINKLFSGVFLAHCSV